MSTTELPNATPLGSETPTVNDRSTPSSIKKSPSATREPSVEPTAPVGDDSSRLGKYHKFSLLVLFCVANFLEAVQLSALFPTIPQIAEDLGMIEQESVWLLSAYQLTFAAFLLMSGRLTDVYNPKHVFNVGIGGVGIVSLISGFLRNKIALIVMRAFTGIFAALTIPSALALIVHLYTDPVVQGRAITSFNGNAAIGNVSGLVIGALFAQLVSWPWVFYFTAIVAIPVAIFCVILIPSHPVGVPTAEQKAIKQSKGLDFVGVATVTISLILFVFAVTSGSSVGWGTARVITPLILSFLLMGFFFIWEYKIPENNAALPPRLWFYPNFAVIIGVSLYPYMWWIVNFFIFSSWFEDVYGWSELLTAAAFLPIGVMAGVTMFIITPVALKYFKLRTIILTDLILILGSTILLSFASTQHRYWSMNFIAWFFGSSGVASLVANASIALFASTPSTDAGVVGAIFMSSIQLGTAIGTSVVTSIQTSVDEKNAANHTGSGYEGRAAGLYFMTAWSFLTIIAVAVFFKPPKMGGDVEAPTVDVAEKEAEQADAVIGK